MNKLSCNEATLHTEVDKCSLRSHTSISSYFSFQDKVIQQEVSLQKLRSFEIAVGRKFFMECCSCHYNMRFSVTLATTKNAAFMIDRRRIKMSAIYSEDPRRWLKFLTQLPNIINVITEDKPKFVRIFIPCFMAWRHLCAIPKVNATPCMIEILIPGTAAYMGKL